MNLKYILLLSSLIYIINVVSGSCRLREQVSIVLPKTKLQCFRLLNGTHQTGCQSEKNGNSGTVIAVESLENFMSQLTFYEKTEEKIIALCDLEQLTPELVNVLHDNPTINGIILYGQPKINLLSEDASCPLSEFSIYNESSCRKLNPTAFNELGLRFINWEKPIFYVDDKRELNVLLVDCYETFNRNLTVTSSSNEPRCRAKLTMFMHSAGDAETCLRRQNLFYGFTDSLSMCEPLTSNNVFNLIPPTNINDPLDIFLLSSRLDSFSTFSSAMGGDVSVLTTVITMLSIADAIGKKPELFETKAKASNRQLLLSFFNGESLGYIGSGRAAFDMLNGEFPQKFKKFESQKTGPQIRLNDIKVFLELQQLGFSSDTNEYFMHVDGDVYQDNADLLDNLVSDVKSGLSQYNIKSSIFDTTTASQTLPSSYLSFLRHNQSIVGAVFSPTKDKFKFPYINSLEDMQITLNPENRVEVVNHLYNMASGIMKGITGYVHKNRDSAKDYPIDKVYIETLVECFLNTQWNCTYFQTIIPEYEAYHAFRNLYIGTAAQQSPMWHITKSLLIQALGETQATPNVKTKEQCDTLNPGQSVYHYAWAYNEEQNKSVCYRTVIFTPVARSPAFTQYGLRSELFNYSTWVESIWDPPKLEIFLDERRSNIFQFFIGLLITGLSILITRFDWYQVNPHATPPVIIHTANANQTQRQRRKRRAQSARGASQETTSTEVRVLPSGSSPTATVQHQQPSSPTSSLAAGLGDAEAPGPTSMLQDPAIEEAITDTTVPVLPNDEPTSSSKFIRKNDV